MRADLSKCRPKKLCSSIRASPWFTILTLVIRERASRLVIRDVSGDRLALTLHLLNTAAGMPDLEGALPRGHSAERHSHQRHVLIRARSDRRQHLHCSLPRRASTAATAAYSTGPIRARCTDHWPADVVDR